MFLKYILFMSLTIDNTLTSQESNLDVSFSRFFYVVGHEPATSLVLKCKTDSYTLNDADERRR